MLCFNDRTYCASPNCENACGRKMTPRDIELAKKSPFPVSWSMFCGEVSMDEMRQHIEKEFTDAATERQEC
jgi:hypothetical protein